MKIKWNKSPEQVCKEMSQDIDDFTRRLIDATGKDIKRATRRNFQRAEEYVPADDPYVYVSNTPATSPQKNVWETTIICGGDQVLFIEFGAGQLHASERPRTSALILDGEEEIEPPRPSGIVGLGHYGQHRGQQDAWFYKSQTGRESIHSHIAKLNRRGEFIMITSGISPVRALWRATTNALKRVRKGKMKIK